MGLLHNHKIIYIVQSMIINIFHKISKDHNRSRTITALTETILNTYLYTAANISQRNYNEEMEFIVNHLCNLSVMTTKDDVADVASFIDTC